MVALEIVFIPFMVKCIRYVGILFLSFCFLLSLPPESQSIVADEAFSGKKYSILYDRLLMFEQEGKIEEALRMIPEVYGSEIPVDSFYVTLENKRQQLLKAVSQQEKDFSSIRQLFRDFYLRKTESYQQIAEIYGDLDVKRFCYFVVVESWYRDKPVSRIDPRSTLTGADPWLVAAALFLGRKQKHQTITPQDVINRWQSRPDLWDEECTRQALLFLAKFDTVALKALEITNEDVRLQVEKLRPVPKDQGYIVPLLFSRYGENVSYRSTFRGVIVHMKENKNRKGVIKRWAGDTNHFSSFEPVMEQRIKAWNLQDGAIAVEPGSYQMRFSSVSGRPPSGYYGKSVIVEVQRGKLVVIPIALTPAI